MEQQDSNSDTKQDRTELYHQILKKYWGFDSFRPLQIDIISAIDNGKSALALMPTGGGKSITFQVPALAKGGLCIVISPLIALIKDQVENLKNRGIRAAAIYSGMNHYEILQTLEDVENGNFSFLYCSPERVRTELFLKRIDHLNVSMIAVDEAHCISQWGYDFRPSYLLIADLLKILPKQTPVLALTATATPEVVEDIMEKLLFEQKLVFKKSFERKNLIYVTRETESKLEQMLRILNRVKGSSIVYVRSRLKTKELSDFINKNGGSADFFHAGLPDSDKSKKQELWKKNKIRVMVATNAFGMGIDKPNVRTVIHFDLPDSLEAYFQEAGRAGRDEKLAYAVLLYNKADTANLKRRTTEKYPDKQFIKNIYQYLADTFLIAEGTGFESCFYFSLQEFCAKCKTSQNQTYNALKILEMSGYINLSEELDNPSVLQFIVSKNRLVATKLTPELESLVEVLLRSYTGLFSQQSRINETFVADKLNTDRNTVYENLITLSKLGITKYIPYKKSPLLTYSKARVDSNKLIIPKEAYENRQERSKKQIEAVIEYAEDNSKCLNQKLFRYFGEKRSHNCGICSVCIDQNRQALEAKSVEKIEEKIIEVLTKKPATIKQLTDIIEERADNIVFVVRKMLDNDKLYRQGDTLHVGK